MPSLDDHIKTLMKDKGHSFHSAVEWLCQETGDTPMGVIHNLEPYEDAARDPNIRITRDEMALIRRLSDFDLTMLLSDIDGHRWQMARRTLWLIREQPEYQKPQKRRPG
jgi:hypothetical protein